MNNCTRAETKNEQLYKSRNEELKIDCVNKATNVKIRALNRLSETLVEKCGGEISYTEEEK